MAKQIKVPKTFGACADRLFAIKALKKPIAAALDTLDEERKAIEAHLIKSMPKEDGGGVGKLAQAEIVIRQEPTVTDRLLLQQYILDTGAWELMQGAVSAPAVKERWEQGEAVPGVSPFAVTKISVTKR